MTAGNLRRRSRLARPVRTAVAGRDADETRLREIVRLDRDMICRQDLPLVS